MKKAALISLFVSLTFIQKVVAQWYLDSPTPEEAAVRDKPYMYLEGEIRKKLCDQNWAVTPENDFEFLQASPQSRLILRGKSIYRFDLTRGGDECNIMLRQGSPMFKENFDKQVAGNKLMLEKKYKIDGPEYKEWNKSMDRLNHDKTLATVSLVLNEDRVAGKHFQNAQEGKAFKIEKVAGVQQAILYCEYPGKDASDTLYWAYLYIGNFPSYSGKMEPVHYKYLSKTGWSDKAHSGKPIIENIRIHISAFHYNNIMKVIRDIDWTGLDAMIKE